ncbi:serine/threonine-protein kinase VRK2 isoform X1 [Entelurus aequoreus]|uniref:serine/threonine-protein kinase VRK2 isoform X1 n=2 Tax=Entelurus aequoreus TaxID=161455 RepID=UPI002B1D97E7|nr:serine/threonine-protein kinase VRK2 isoform X1 [Entelurus aequoreus]XP_061914864.1 serine/threonine-protein kinase VRK2 isoform X1 [Entelurus aequoreus]XP_061914866.1 serine/threonine-protein kinase VRK2 isoform X1 [Entelurus aequoreus]XP_061914867.1 serine/threonine-protein kinase VRK2 isoform X1 [Entelurus aequoreus]
MAPKKRVLPKPLPDGFILIDLEKKKWRLGKIIGQGGFGLIYLASKVIGSPVSANTDFVIKLEYEENGPLFSELKFYQRAAKPECMQKWMDSRRLDHLGVPTYWGAGQAEHNDLRYRFMVMERLGTDLQKICERNGGRVKKASVLRLGQVVVDVLEYMHQNEYVHADIKASNLMLGYKDSQKVYLVDYGLSYRYCPDGAHKEYKENPKKGHNGTIEYTSLDAHRGVVPSRRGDLQILGFCLLHWLSGSLPWDNVLHNPTAVMEAKIRLMDNLPQSVQKLSVTGASTTEVAALLQYVKSLRYQDRPDYQRLRKMLSTEAKEKLDFSIPQGPGGSKVPDHPIRGKRASKSRGLPEVKSQAKELEDEDDAIDEEMKLKQLPACYRQTPLPQKTEGVQGSLRLRPAAVKSYKEDESWDDDDDKEEEARSKPIDARYLRGPPIGHPREKTQSRSTDELPMGSMKQEVGEYQSATRERDNFSHTTEGEDWDDLDEEVQQQDGEVWMDNIDDDESQQLEEDQHPSSNVMYCSVVVAATLLLAAGASLM